MKFNQNNVNEGQRKVSAYLGSVEIEDNCKLESLQVVAMKRLSQVEWTGPLAYLFLFSASVE